MPFLKDEKSLERVAGDMAFSRGRSYYLRGTVKTMARSGNYLEGVVQGEELDPFQVTIRIKGLNEFKRAQCTCPFTLGKMCKHSVAVLLHWMHYLRISTDVDLTKTLLFDEKKLKTNSLATALPQSSLSNEQRPKKSRKAVYLLPEYQFRTSQKPRIQIALLSSGFIGGDLKSIPFKIFIINGEDKFVISNLKLLINSTRSRPNNFPEFSAFSPMQQYVLNFLNELLMVDERSVNFSQQQFRIKRMQWAVYLGVIAGCPDVEFIDIKTNELIDIKTTEKIVLTLKIRLIEKGQWGIKASFKDPLNPLRDFNKVHIQHGHPIWLFDEALSSFQSMHEAITYSFLKDFLNVERILDEGQMPYFISSILNSLRNSCEIIEEGEPLNGFVFTTPALRCRVNLDYVKDAIKLKLLFVYENHEAYPFEGKECLERFANMPHEKGKGWVVRDIAQENKNVQYLMRDCNFDWKKNSKAFVLSGTDSVLDFVRDQFPVLKKTMDVHCSSEFEDKLLDIKFLEPLVKISSSGIDWFEFNAVYKIKGIDEEITHAKIKKLISEGQRYIRLKKGQILPIPREMFDRIEQLSEEFDHTKFHLAQMPFVMEEFNRLGLESQVDSKIKAIYEELKNFKSIESTVIPEFLTGVLRDYQGKGVDWLAFLKKFHFGGVLADEMGLGKTLQALTMLQKEIEQGNTLPSLVVCPTTLVWNWQEEIKKFLPGVRVLVINGNHRRELFKEVSKAQVVITSYPLLRRDIELYKKISFNYVILDEAQNIKNRNTQNSQVAKSLKASMRLAMTGTPVENSIMDLWSIFDFLMPGFLGSAGSFKRRYEIPITKFQDKEQLQKLSNRILPFVLRRLKKDVLKDLPEKIEQISFCELEPTQAKIYGKMVESSREIATKSVNENGFEKSRMVILTLILRLRQICCHPIIAGVDLGHRSVSGKMELLKETLNELLAGGHKVLIFSQFVQMLSVMEDYLKHEKISYAYMDGSSKDRQEEVDRFNNDPTLKVFLLSLKVGGVGLNLTSADTVIIYEPWWNPAVENQAIDRVHRIGQNNSVLAYRLITKGTIEEKMIELQNRKRFLMDALVLSEEGVGKKLDWEDIKFLLDLK
ncbi:MAG: SNF2-related protein, partial [Candidatus Omnitrophota bacterium]